MGGSEVNELNASSLKCLLLLAACAASVATPSDANEFIHSDNIERRGDLFYELGKDHPLSGMVIATYDDGSRKLEQPFKDGKQIGVQKQWHEDGVQKAEIRFRDGKLHGISTWWYPSGQTRIWLNFTDGRLHGRGTFWHKNGLMKSEGRFRHGEVVGEHSFWDERGRKLSGQPRNYPEVPRTDVFE
jgi:antitoxin component YwqK of YwqJK toxin-antitoxin module